MPTKDKEYVIPSGSYGVTNMTIERGLLIYATDIHYEYKMDFLNISIFISTLELSQRFKENQLLTLLSLERPLK